MGVIVRNGIPYSGNANEKSVTWAQYCALSEAEKLNGMTYYINDATYSQLVSPVVYSEDEQEIGVWVDGKPLYQKTYILTTAVVVSMTDWTDSGIPKGDIETIVNVIASNSNGVTVWGDISASLHGGTNILLLSHRNGDTEAVGQLTLQYTKSTDVAGSGTYASHGLPAIHYSTEEQVIGTWIDGSSVYLKMSPNKGTNLPINQSWVDTGIEVTGEIINVYGSILRDNEPIGICWFNSETAVKWLVRDNKLMLGLLAPSGGSYKINNIFAVYTKSTS